MSNNEKYFDVIICGAGPAGSTCALALSKSGLRVALIDKNSFPRDKVCGDAIAPYARKVLLSIDPKFASAFDAFEKRHLINTYRIFAPNGKYVDVLSEENGMIAKRYDWDNFLFQLAASQPNITCLLNSQVTVVKNLNEEIVINAGEQLLRTKIAVGCDGAHSIIAKKLCGFNLDLDHHSAAVRSYFRNVSEIAHHTIELHFLEGILPGYFWIFPLPDQMANVGIGCSSATVSKNKMNLRKLLESIISSHPIIKKRFIDAEMIGSIEGFGLPLGSRKVRMSGNNFMLCGDAASLIDPLTGEGIGPAMVSGRYAGWHAKKCFEMNNFSASFMRQYDEQVLNKFWESNRKRYHLQQQIIKRPFLINGLINLANSNSIAHRLLVNAFT